MDTVSEHAGFREALEASRAQAPGLAGKRLTYTAIRHMLGAFVADLIDATRERLACRAPRSVDEVRGAAEALVDFSPDMREDHLRLKRLLYQRLYYDPSVQRIAEQAKLVVTELFDAFMNKPALLPSDAALVGEPSEQQRACAVSDYIAGMTDRYALAEHGRVFGVDHAGAAQPWRKA